MQLVGLNVVIINYVNLIYSNILRVAKSMLSLLKLSSFEVQAEGCLVSHLAISRKVGTPTLGVQG